jgi:hypothetical protein
MYGQNLENYSSYYAKLIQKNLLSQVSSIQCLFWSTNYKSFWYLPKKNYPLYLLHRHYLLKCKKIEQFIDAGNIYDCNKN